MVKWIVVMEIQHSIYLYDWGKLRQEPPIRLVRNMTNSKLSELESSVMNFDRPCALSIQKLYHRRTSQSAGAGIRASIFNRCNDATVRTGEVPLVHATYDGITLSRTRKRFTQEMVY